MKVSSSFSNQTGNEHFLDILTLGLNAKLKNTEAITFLNIEKRIPCTRLAICAWEQNNGIRLPSDLKEFYASTDGFTLTWKYQNVEKESDVKGRSVTINGEIKVCPLTNLHKLHCANHRKFSDQQTHYVTLHENILRTLSSVLKTEKQYELVAVYMLSHYHNVGTVCIIYYTDKKQNPSIEAKLGFPSSIWLLDAANCWHFLAENFSTYFRMMLVHFGLEHWLLKFTSSGLTPSGQRAMAIAIPHLLYEDWNGKNSDTVFTMPRNIINTNIFKIGALSSKTSKLSASKNNHHHNNK